MPQQQAKLSPRAVQARIMFLSLPLFLVGCALLSYLLRRGLGFDQPTSVYIAALPALVASLALGAVIVRIQAKRRSARARR
jgi:hypothetical protein